MEVDIRPAQSISKYYSSMKLKILPCIVITAAVFILFALSQGLSGTSYSTSGYFYSVINVEIIKPLFITSLILFPGALLFLFAPDSAFRKWLTPWLGYVLVFAGILTLPPNTNTWLYSWDLTRAPAMYMWAVALVAIAVVITIRELKRTRNRASVGKSK